MLNSKHMPVLDSLRAFAALSVCLFHFVCSIPGFINSEIIKSIFSYGECGVQMFFVISGFIIPWSLFNSSYSIKNYFTFVTKRFIRLEPPYLVSLLLAVLITYVRVMSPHYNGLDITPSAKQIALHFGYLIPFFKDQTWIRPIYWTLAIEFQYYLSLGLLFPLIANNKMVYRVLSYIVVLSGPFLIKSFLPFHLPEFLFGISLFLYKSKIIGYKELIILTIAAGIEILFFHSMGKFVFASIAYISILYFMEFKNKILSFLGNISYSIYLFHSLIGMVLLNYLSHTIINPVYRLLLILLALGVSIIAAYLVYRFVELPSKMLSSKIKYKKDK